MKSIAFVLVIATIMAQTAVASPVERPVKVFILAGQSNMEGQAVADLDGKDYNDGKGTLRYLLRDPARSHLFKHLIDAKGQWTVRDDVWVRYEREDAPLLAGPLSMGFSVYGDKHHFGPELQFGHVVGNHFADQVLIIKTAWGGKSLYEDFRPPSSGGKVGPYYTRMLADIRAALANLKRDFPAYKGQGYELSGFVWYHGWNDGVAPKTAVPEYEQNLVNLIKDLRKDLNAPKLPCVIGELTGPWVQAPDAWAVLRKAQAAAAARLEFKGTVKFVETHDFVRKPEDSPNPGHGHHEFGNAETYFLVGDALGKGMLSLLPHRSVAEYQSRKIEGWSVQVRKELLENEKDATETALTLLRNQLIEIVRVVPRDAVAKLREVTLWFSPVYPGALPKAEYHPGRDWLVENIRNPAMVKGVEFTNIGIFEKETRRMPNFVLHELAHGYHDRVLGFENAEIAAAYERAKASGIYDSVERWHGDGRPNTFERAYAMTDPKEYFAESSEAFFGRNDFFPFTREDLRKYDPVMDKLLENVWHTASRTERPTPNGNQSGQCRTSTFKDRTAELGLSLGGDGACWVDIDNDGWVDLCAGGAVWKNSQGKGFTKVADVGAVVAADFDNDGFADLFSWSQMKLYRNKGGKGFEEFKLPELPATVSRGACWCDLNRDGFVDLYIGGYEDWDKDITYPSMILMNHQGKSFKLEWTEAKYRTRGVTACDFNQDGDMDVYVSNYRLQPNLLMMNDGAGHLKDAAPAFNAVATSPGFDGGHSIGACWGDFDNDGYFDLFAGNFAHQDDRGDQPKSRFLRNLGPMGGYKFEDRGTCGVFYQESYASPAAGDFDNDGNLDLFFTTVYATASFNRKNYPVLYRNGGGFVFSDATTSAGLSELGATYQAAWADFDHNGTLDLVTAGKFFVNQGSGNHWIEVRLAGDGKTVNRSAIGSQARIKRKDRILTRQVEAGTGEGNQNDLTLHFGLDSKNGAVNLEILWPNGKKQTIRRMRPNRIIDISYRGK